MLLLVTACSGGGGAVPKTTGDSSSQAAGDGTSATQSAASSGAVKGSFESFTATDIDNNTVTQELFKGYKVTMINVWGTYCSPCIDEMPYLAELNNEYTDKGFRVIGIVVDAAKADGSIDQGIVSTARDLIFSTGASYLHLLPSADLNKILLNDVEYIPTTVFVDENGKLIGSEPYVGSRTKEDWKTLIDGIIGEMQ